MKRICIAALTSLIATSGVFAADHREAPMTILQETADPVFQSIQPAQSRFNWSRAESSLVTPDPQTKDCDLDTVHTEMVAMELSG